MKSREEIIQGLPHMMEYPNYIHENDVEQAMTEYADQFVKEFEYWKYENRVSSVMHDDYGLYYHYKGGKDITHADLLTIFKKERGIE